MSCADGGAAACVPSPPNRGSLSCRPALHATLHPRRGLPALSQGSPSPIQPLSGAAVAVRLLGGGALTPAAIGNMWWLNTDPNIANFTTGA